MKELEKAAREHRLEAFVEVVASNSFEDGVLSLVQLSGISILRPNTVVICYPRAAMQMPLRESSDAITTFVSNLKNVVSLEKAVILLKGIDAFPNRTSKQTGTIDVYWIMQDGGLLTLLSYLLKKHRVWRRCTLR